jgi:hypothetical protein
MITFVSGVHNETGVQTRIMGVRDESHREKDGIDLVIPVTRTATKAIKSFAEKPIFIRLSSGISRRRANDCDFLGR